MPARRSISASTVSALITAPKASAAMAQRDPVVLRVPDEHGDGEKREDREQRRKAGAAQFVPKFRRKREEQENREDLHRVGVFREEAATDERAGQRPPRGERGAFLQ